MAPSEPVVTGREPVARCSHDTKGPHDPAPSTQPFPDLSLVVCPHCRSELAPRGPALHCDGCSARFDVTGGIANLQVERGFDDDDHIERWACEECTGTHMIEHYMVPLLRRLHPERAPGTLSMLSIGCGVGIDVEQLQAHGYRCHGIDVGNRAKTWARRADPRWFTRAAVQRMPFRTGQFDFAFLNCVLPHVGVVGDTQQVAPDWQQQRALAVAETIRVVRPGGHILLSNPNRLCPLDLFHRRDERSHMPRLHGPAEPFLQSFDDLRGAFVRDGGCRSAVTLPPANFWGFSPTSKSSRYAVGRVLQASVKAYFAALSVRALAPLRTTALNPWLVVLVAR